MTASAAALDAGAGDVKHAHRRRQNEGAGSAETQETPHEKHPRRDETDMEARNREEMDQAGFGEVLLNQWIDAASASQHEGIDQRCSRAVECAARSGESCAQPRSDGRNAPGPPG